jgi:histone H1/5
LKDNRKTIKGKNVAEVAKKAGGMWKSLPADKKKVYEDRASKAKTEYAAYIAKIKDTEAFKTYKDEKAVARKKKLRRSVKIAMHKVPMDKSLKKPLSGYMLWFKDARKSIKGKNFAEVGKKAGEMWKSMTVDKKKTFADKAADAQKKYAAYIATGKGAAALKAYKDGIAKAKAPLLAKDGKLKAKKAAAKAKAKAKAAAKKEKKKAAKAKKVAAKAAKAAKKKAAKAAKAAKKKAAKAKKAAKKAGAMKAKKAMKAMKAKKSAMKSKAPMKAMKAKKAVMKAKKLIESISDAFATPVTVLVAALFCGGIVLAMVQSRRSVSSPNNKALLSEC